MQQDARLFLRSVLVGVLAIVCAGCNNPARLAMLSGAPAEELETFNPAEPVLVARADGDVVAIVFSKEEADIPQITNRLIVAEVESCDKGGRFGIESIGGQGPVLCCDEATDNFVLNTERGWLRTGERCEKSDAEENASDEDSSYPGEEGIKFEPASRDLSRILKEKFGVDYPFMSLAVADEVRGGGARALVNGSLPGAENKQSATQPFGIMASPQIIPAGHKKPTPVGGCVSSLGQSCSLGGSAARCRKQYWHVYYKDGGSNQWCEFPPTCGC